MAQLVECFPQYSNPGKSAYADFVKWQEEHPLFRITSGPVWIDKVGAGSGGLVVCYEELEEVNVLCPICHGTPWDGVPAHGRCQYCNQSGFVLSVRLKANVTSQKKEEVPKT